MLAPRHSNQHLLLTPYRFVYHNYGMVRINCEIKSRSATIHPIHSTNSWNYLHLWNLLLRSSYIHILINYRYQNLHYRYIIHYFHGDIELYHIYSNFY